MDGADAKMFCQALLVVHQMVGINHERVELAERQNDELLEVMTPVARQDAFVSAAFHGRTQSRR